MLLGIDIGTQSLKAVVTDEALRPLGEGSRPYAFSCPHPGWAEQDPRLWLAALRPAIADALAAAGRSGGDVRGIGIAGQLDGCLAVDAAGDPLGPCLIWMDRRAEAEMPGIDLPALRRRTGVVPDPIHMGAKIRWLSRRSTPAAAMYHQPVSFVVQRLCGAAVMDAALASTSMLYDLEAGDYAPDLLAAFEVERHLLPALAPCASAAGALTDAAAQLCGLPAGIPVAVGTGDDFAGALGGGVLRPGILACTLGTAEVVGALHAAPLIDASDMLETHAFPTGQFFVENPGWLCGGAVGWLAGILGLQDTGTLHEAAARSPPGARGLLFLPAMTGAMAPRWYARARGAFYGLTPAHDRGDLARALLEGCAFAMRDVLDRLRAMGVAVGAVRLMGGGARSDIWPRIRADVAGLPVELMDGGDCSALGAAACAAVAAGVFPDLASALALRADPARVVAPDPLLADVYADRHAAYSRLFRSLRPMFEAP